MNIRQQLLLIACTASITVVSACGTSPPARLYLVEPLAVPDTETPPNSLTVLVDKVVLPEYLTRKEILSRDQHYVVNAAMFDRWAEPLDANVTATLAQNLSTLIRSERVVAYPWVLEELADFRVSVQILAFGPAPNGNVVLAALWRITEAAGDTKVLRRSRFSEVRQSTDPTDTVSAMSRALAELSSEIASFLQSISVSPVVGEKL